VINIQPTLFTIGLFLTCLAVMMAAPALLDYIHHDINWQAFALSSVITGFIGLLVTFANKPKGSVQMSIRETFLLTAFSWIIVAIFSAFPFILSNSTNTLVDSFFEAVSGLTTTGASVMMGVDFTSPGIILWRALLQWLGGIGIIVMALTVMPLLKIGGMQLFRSEFSDRSEKVLPRVSQISSAIITTYVFFTALCILCLWAAGMSWLEAVCYAFSTLSTGGFATTDASIAHYNSPVIEAVIIVFMIIGSTTLILFVKFFHGDRQALWKDSQVQVFIGILLLSILIVTTYLWLDGIEFLSALREASFNVTSIITTTGFNAGDYTYWGTFPLMMFFMLMMVGGCTGSTTGSIKIFRYQIMCAVAKNHIYHMRRPHGVFLPLYNGKRIPGDIFTSVFTFFALYIISFGLLVLGLSAYELDISTCLSGAASCLNNVGPGFGPIIGPAGNFSPLPDEVKWMLMAGMLVGRLEYITIIILFFPSFWRH
jgi:trk system potassium uptake protein TrkH